ncbi:MULTISPECIES: NADP-dependent malic enzyme [Rhizobium/Agrobacterium group]|jgi:malate dehydrogenase (oxaloacetate-decarboxylating)(NADP+)|uniref:NADP-dependent malic enzyme n=1 Tax=Rhizobium/Agrobacterium group TaxID=227290 RepID=UPI0007138628|nr:MULTISPECIES: NADP-dependent malic enzyme [Rhizobium/Agrobacterium group]KQQ36936.1 malic enzyme [Rhizobium sp. Leaf306]KQQ72685.1 malic enzyme [Rhizobium sp. Leaf321]MBD8650567.1 NADP-dependent malic enzyme [Rhizobium sp. CFBP 13726]MBD8662943.1 NADP-dependent malic enzyme [Rhizobium sp. CFBP 8752]MBP2461297.1 malate dehydrogenase (oxaloacetate-decarboxylating)(NADP+) [Rhizobium sp. PvP014]
MDGHDNPKPSPVTGDLDEQALFFHRYPRPGKLEIQATKPLGNQRDLALAYSPGVAAPCLAIRDNPEMAAEFTARANLVAVVSNGTAVLGLGNIGPLASKPVMEGKAVLFKKFAGIDVFDIEIDAPGIEAMVSTISALEPTFGGINLEDIKSPECFEVERRLREKMNIPVFHDDQHGTAIIVAAAILNGLELAGKTIDNVKIVTSGAGAAALACLHLLVSLGAKKENIWVHDIEGLVYEGRVELMDEWKAIYAQKSDNRVLADNIAGADVFLGLSAAGVLKPELLVQMAEKPLIMALANPTPEIMPELARAERPDAMICTGRSDFANQVNNVLCFPYIFRGALDCGARTINEEMKMAAVKAIAALAREEVSDVAAKAYSGETPIFGPDYLIPSPFDPRLILRIAPAVARAAAESGVAARPIQDFEAYLDQLSRFVWRSGFVMKPIFTAAKTAERNRVIFAEGEDERVLRAAQILLEEQIARPILIGRPSVIEARLQRFGIRIRPNVDFAVVNPEDDPRYRGYVDDYFALVGRQGVNPEAARTIVRTSNTVIGALSVQRGEADALICGIEGRYDRHLRDVNQIIGKREGTKTLAGLSLLISQRGAIFFTDTFVNYNPTAEEIAEITILSAQEVRRFGIKPKAALICHSNFGSRNSESAAKMRDALAIIRERAPDLEVDGEMQGGSALSEELRKRAMPSTTLSGEANLLVFPNLDAASISLGLVRTMMDALHVGPILLGTAKPAHVLGQSVTSRGVVNMAALAVVEASQPESLFG